MDNALQYKVCESLLNLYCLYRQRWVCMMDPQKTVYPIQTVKERFTDGHVINHLNGNYTMCVFAGKSATKFLCVDVDLGEPEVVHRVVDTIEDMGIPRQLIYVSSSGRKGYHVEIFFENFIYNSCAEKFYWGMIERGQLNPRKVEYRPTHTQAIKLPLGVHQTTQRRCWYVDRETLEPIERFDYIFEIERIPQAYMNELVDGIVNEHMREIYAQVNANANAKHERAVVATESLVVTQPGTRHNIQKKVAARARLDGHDYDSLVDIQMKWYAQQDQSLIGSTESEVLADAEKIAAWAIKNVVPKHAVQASQKTGNGFIRVHKSSIPYILNAPTKSTRLVLFLLVLFCDVYGEVKITYETIAKYTGFSEYTVGKAIAWLAAEKFIAMEHTFHKVDVFATKKGANRYSFPGEKKYYSPDRKYLNVDYVDIHEMITAENLREIYYRTLGAICKPEYLARYLTKPELGEIAKYAADKNDRTA